MRAVGGVPVVGRLVVEGGEEGEEAGGEAGTGLGRVGEVGGGGLTQDTLLWCGGAGTGCGGVRVGASLVARGWREA